MPNPTPFPFSTTSGSSGRKKATATLLATLLTLTSCQGFSRNRQISIDVPADYSSVGAVCDLLTRMDLRLVLGREFLEGTDHPGFDAIVNRRIGAPPESYSFPPFADIVGMTTCQFPPAKGTRDSVATGVATAFAPRLFQKLVKSDKSRRLRATAGLPSRPVWHADRLFVMVNDKLLGLGIVRDPFEPEDAFQQRAIRLMVKAISRMD